jgi:hypothetical protein
MSDIFNNIILCKNCKKPMKNFLMSKNGFNLRIKKCEKCNLSLIHPQDKMEYKNFIRLKQKEYSVKMRRVGNSYTVSIPREIVNFMKEQEKMIDNMVKLSFEETGRLKLLFNTPEMNEVSNSRIIKSKEIKITKNGKTFHAQQFLDSANPKNNKKIIFTNELEEK